MSDERIDTGNETDNTDSHSVDRTSVDLNSTGTTATQYGMQRTISHSSELICLVFFSIQPV